jgi:uncharacterized protein YndB with AHSA1/START domain
MPEPEAKNGTPNAERVVRERSLHKEVVVAAPIDRVWWGWTTSQGMASWWAKESWIDLRIGGPYELYFLLDRPRGGRDRRTAGS